MFAAPRNSLSLWDIRAMFSALKARYSPKSQDPAPSRSIPLGHHNSQSDNQLPAALLLGASTAAKRSGTLRDQAGITPGITRLVEETCLTRG